MHLRSVLHILGTLLLLLGGALLLPLASALVFDDGKPLERYEVLAFIATIATATISGLALRSLFEVELSKIGNREGAAIVTLTWVLFSLVGCLPYVITGTAGLTDGFFETMSGFSTTGATIFRDVELLPSGLQLWRHQTQWIGGMGIVVLSVAILPLLGVGGYRMFKAEAPGGSTFERNAPRIKHTAKVLWVMYLSLTLVEAVLLGLGGMSGYEALCHAFTTMSTGGFSTSSQSIAGWPAPFIQWTIIGFMLLAGVNFDVYQKLISGPRRAILRDAELRVYLAVIVVAATLHACVLLGHEVAPAGLEPTIRASVFSVVSVGTTTGYGTEDFDRWPDVLRLTLMLMMFVGGCAGSTAGGMKLYRIVIFFKSAVTELRRSVRPRAVVVVRVGDRPLEPEVVSNVMGFLVMWLALFAALTYVLAALGLDLLTASSAAVTNLGNVGPGLGSVGPACNYAHLSNTVKWLLAGSMLLGRLELYSPLMLALKQTWVR